MASNPPRSSRKGSFLTREFMGLPTWAWMIGGVVFLGAVLYFQHSKSAASSAQSAQQGNASGSQSMNGSAAPIGYLYPTMGPQTPTNTTPSTPQSTTPTGLAGAGTSGYTYSNGEQYRWAIFSPSSSMSAISQFFWGSPNYPGMLTAVGQSWTDPVTNEVLWVVPTSGGNTAPQYQGPMPPPGALSGASGIAGVTPGATLSNAVAANQAA